MEIYFLRHGIAEPKSDWRGEDVERPLSAEGRQLVVEMAASLVKQQVAPDWVLTSPYARARQTAQIIAEQLEMTDKVVVDDRLAPGFGMKQLTKLLRDYRDSKSILLVGHGPEMGELVGEITGGRLALRKAGLAQVDLPDPKALKGRLISLMVPTPIASADEVDADSDS